MDWFKGKFTGKPHDLHGKIHGFRLRFSPTNQSIEIGIHFQIDDLTDYPLGFAKTLTLWTCKSTG
jgi:hypothetical protein